VFDSEKSGSKDQAILNISIFNRKAGTFQLVSVITHSVFVFKAVFLITGRTLIPISGLLNNELRKRLDADFKK